jgi:hypothetical protein
MTDITKIVAIKTMTAIWEYDSFLPDNCVLCGSLIIAAIHTTAIKVYVSPCTWTSTFPQIQASS